MVTTNQVKSFASNNVYVQHYYEIENQLDSKKYQRARHKRSIRFGSFGLDQITLINNEAYYRAQKALAEKFPEVYSLSWNSKNESFYIHHDFIIYDYTIPLYIVARIDKDGSYQIGFDNPGFCGKGKQEEWYVTLPNKKNIRWCKYEILKITEAYLQSQLYGDGFFAQLQLKQRWTKQKVKQWYADYTRKWTIEENYWPSKQTLKLIRKKYNLIFDEMTSLDEIHDVLKQFHGKKFEIPKLVKRYDWTWLANFDGDMDELKKEYWENNGEPDTIYY